MGEVNERTAHTCTLSSHHAWNRILEHQPARALLTPLLSNPITLVIKSIYVPSKPTSSGKEYVRKRLAATSAVIGRAYDVGGTKVCKDKPVIFERMIWNSLTEKKGIGLEQDLKQINPLA